MTMTNAKHATNAMPTQARKTNPAAGAVRVTSAQARLAHADCLELYNDLSSIAAGGYPMPLTEDQRAAYALLPGLIDDCERTWNAIPEDARPVHWLSNVFPAHHRT